MPERKSVRILLIEDSPTAAELVRRRLSEGRDGFLIEHVVNLDEADRALDQPWDVILLDLGLPGVDDLEALAWTRARSPEVPIVVLTGHDDLALAIRALRAEAQDYLVKHSIDARALARAIRYAMGRQQILGRLARAVEDARASEARLRELMERSSDGIVVVAEGGAVVFANAAAEELFGLEGSELVGRPIPGLDLENGEVSGPFGRVLEARTSDVEWEGARARLAMLRDVTERRRAEELRVQLERSERLAAVGRLAAGVAHEINNPLTYVIANIELTLRRLERLAARPEEHDDAAFMRHRLHDARDGLDRVVRIVRDLRAFARVEPDLDVSPVDVRDALESALKMAEPQLKHRARAVLRFADVPPVRATEGRLTQVFLNLLLNAAQAIEVGAVEKNSVEVSTELDGDHVLVRVRDTGRGIPKEHFARLFEPFFSTKPAGEGTGLGLSICRSLVETYGGTMYAESEVGAGTTITVRLQAWTGGPARAPEPELFSRSPAPAERRRVLVIDDEPAILDALVELLRDEHDVCTARSAAEAKALLVADGSYGAILCDLVMDNGTGMELFEWLATERPLLLSRLLFMSGGGTTAEAQDFLARHPERTLQKPLDTAELRRRLARLVAT